VIAEERGVSGGDFHDSDRAGGYPRIVDGAPFRRDSGGGFLLGSLFLSRLLLLGPGFPDRGHFLPGRFRCRVYRGRLRLSRSGRSLLRLDGRLGRAALCCSNLGHFFGCGCRGGVSTLILTGFGASLAGGGGRLGTLRSRSAAATLAGGFASLHITGALARFLALLPVFSLVARLFRALCHDFRGGLPALPLSAAFTASTTLLVPA
jgi:hypothetical protein